jgi:hypothetical protein
MSFDRYFPRRLDSCNVIIVDNGYTLGRDPICHWTDAATLAFILSSDATIVPGDSISFRSTIIAGRTGSGLFSGGNRIVSAPTNTDTIEVVLRAPQQFPSSYQLCGDDPLLLDARHSSGIPRISGLVYNWSVTTVPSTDTTLIRQQLQEARYAPSVTIEPSYLLPKVNYTFGVKLMSFINSTSLWSYQTVSIVNYTIPILTVEGPSFANKLQKIIFRPILTFTSCFPLSSLWQFEWRMVTPSHFLVVCMHVLIGLSYMIGITC